MASSHLTDQHSMKIGQSIELGTRSLIVVVAKKIDPLSEDSHI